VEATNRRVRAVLGGKGQLSRINSIKKELKALQRLAKAAKYKAKRNYLSGIIKKISELFASGLATEGHVRGGTAAAHSLTTDTQTHRPTTGRIHCAYGHGT
jgi:hypothetical protein